MKKVSNFFWSIECPNEGFRKQLLIFQDKLKENNYDLDKIDFQSIEWPPKEGSKYYFEDL